MRFVCWVSKVKLSLFIATAPAGMALQKATDFPYLSSLPLSPFTWREAALIKSMLSALARLTPSNNSSFLVTSRCFVYWFQPSIINESLFRDLLFENSVTLASSNPKLQPVSRPIAWTNTAYSVLPATRDMNDLCAEYSINTALCRSDYAAPGAPRRIRRVFAFSPTGRFFMI